MKFFFKELIIFLGLIVFLSLIVHMKHWIHSPIEHFTHLKTSQFGMLHPIYFSFMIYLVLLVLRGLYNFIMKIFK